MSSLSLAHRAYSYWLLIHPFPVTMVVAFATLLALATARETLDPSRLAHAISTLFFSQAVVGITNDLHDRDLDARGQTWKPLANGSVSPNEARALVAIAAVLMLAFSISLGYLVLALALFGTFAGLLYNYALRGTPFSWFPYVLGFITLPSAIWVAIEHFDARQLLLIPIGLPLLLAVHLAQTLPDMESDLLGGARGLAVTLGRERASLAAWGGCIIGQIGALSSAALLASNLLLACLTTAISFTFVAFSIARHHRDPSSATLRGNFRLIALAAVVLATGWLFALSH